MFSIADICKKNKRDGLEVLIVTCIYWVAPHPGQYMHFAHWDLMNNSVLKRPILMHTQTQSLRWTTHMDTQIYADKNDCQFTNEV